MLADGEIDALITAVQPRCYAEKAPNVGRLFPDYRAAEEAYFRKTGMFPIMHLMAVRKSLAQEYPWLAGNVFKACLQARNLAAEEIKSTGMFYAMLPWLSDDLRRAYDVMGPNMWPYGVTANRKDLEAMLRWSFEQGLAPRQGAVEENIRSRDDGSSLGHQPFALVDLVASRREFIAIHYRHVGCL